jgi:hypothetical protein
MKTQAHSQINATKPLVFMPVQGSLLQRKCACGNHTVAGGKCAECAKNKTGLQRKLAIGASNDPLEQEADRVADEVMRMPDPMATDAGPADTGASDSGKQPGNGSNALQRMCSGCAMEEEDKLRRKPLANTPITPRISALNGPVAARFSLPQQESVVQRQEMEDEEEMMQMKPAGGGSAVPAVTPGVEAGINSLKGGGQPLPESMRAFFEPRFGMDFSGVRVHTDAQAAGTANSVQAKAFTTGRNIVFGAGEYAPYSGGGRRLIAHELAHVVQQGAAGRPAVQRVSNSADTRLPAAQADALVYAAAADTHIQSALINLAADTDLRRRNVPALVAQEGLILTPLTPRHDSPPGAARIEFFVGTVNYATSVTLHEDADYHIGGANRKSIRIRARWHADVDIAHPLVKDLVVDAVSDAAHTMAARQSPGSLTTFDLYRARFNVLYQGYVAWSDDLNPALDSKGPRTDRSRAVFDQIYAEDSAVKAEYDANIGGIRERIDTYTGPEGLNPLNSPRLQTLRAAFFPVATPVPNANYPAFRAAIQAAANALEPADRDTVDNSNEWQLLINQHVTTEAKRAEIRTIIRTPPPAPVVAPAAAPVVAPAGPAAGGGVTPQMFVDGVRIDGPPSPVIANARKEQVTLTPISIHANPAVPIDTRFTVVTPPGRVNGANVSPDSRWPDASASGVPFEPEIINTATVAMTAHLDLVNGPVGLAPARPIVDFPFTIQDNRQTQFIANWFAAVNFNSGAAQEWFDPGTSVVAYRGGTQNFGIGAFLPAAASPNTNPGLTLFVKTRIKRGAVNVAAPATLEPFPPDRREITQISINTAAPGVVPVVGDPLDFEVELIGADRATVLDTKIIAIPVLPEAVYTRAQAIAAAVADNTHFHDTSAAGLLGQMVAAGGVAANVAAAIKPLSPAVPPPGPLITLRPLTVRHNSAAYVASVSGGPDPSKVGYFVGTTYNIPAPDSAHSFADVAGAAAFHLPTGFGPRFVAANRTTDVAAGTKRPDPELIPLIVHEAVHAMDFTSVSTSNLERYKKEFRAYWTDGRFGPPSSALCPVLPGECKEATTDPALPPPGPKSPRARAIFNQVYGSTTYPFVKPAYDNNTGGFRIAVDDYVIPDGINLVVSVRLESLRQLIQGITSANFAARRVTVQGFMGVGAPPPVGALTADEKNEVQRNRAWRDLVNAEITSAANRALIKADLGIPT